MIVDVLRYAVTSGRLRRPDHDPGAHRAVGDPDLAAMAVDDVPGDGQPQTSTRSS